MSLVACPECDLLLNPTNAQVNDKVYCPRCGYMMFRVRHHSIERTLVLSVTGLVLMVPAYFLPMLGIKLFGNTYDGSLWSGVSALLQEGMWAVAILVLLASVLLPFVNMTLAFVLSFYLHFDKVNDKLAHVLRWYQHLNEWAMLEVYALSIIVACVKLSSMADLRFGLGLYAFVALLIVNAWLANEFNAYLFWRKIGKHLAN